MYRTLEAANMDLGLLRDFLLSLSFLNQFFWRHAWICNNVWTSQVPQLPWMSVGCTIPLKQEFFTLEASWAFNMARTHERVELLEWSGYLKQLFNWRTLHTCIGCNATAAWRAPPIWKFGTASICTRICHFFQLYFSTLVLAFAASPAGATSVMLCTHFFDENSAQNKFQLYL